MIFGWTSVYGVSMISTPTPVAEATVDADADPIVAESNLVPEHVHPAEVERIKLAKFTQSPSNVGTVLST